MNCIKCGGDMVGDAYTSPLHCEYTAPPEWAEADSGPRLCDFEPEPIRIKQPAEYIRLKGVIEK